MLFTAISLGAPASSLMVEFSFGLAIGVNALLSKKLGEKDKKGVQKVVGQGFLLTALLYLIFLLAGIFASVPYRTPSFRYRPHPVFKNSPLRAYSFRPAFPLFCFGQKPLSHPIA